MYEAEARAIMMPDKIGFSWRRLTHALFEERTVAVEAILGIVFILLRGVALLGYSYYTPGIEYYLRAVGMSETKLGWACVVLGLLHPYGAGTLRFRLRAWISVGGIFLAVTVISAVWIGGPRLSIPVAVIWLSVLITEIYLALRNWLARDAAKIVLQRNGCHK